MDTILKDFLNSLLYGLISIIMGITSFCLAPEQRHPELICAIGGVFAIGGTTLIAKGRCRLQAFRKLRMNGTKQDVYISVHNTGSGDSSATSFLVKVYPSNLAQKVSITFEASENSNLRVIMESKKIEKATLLCREGNSGMVIIYVDGQMVLPSSGVRHLR